jgi:subtilisin family serine protease
MKYLIIQKKRKFISTSKTIETSISTHGGFHFNVHSEYLTDSELLSYRKNEQFLEIIPAIKFKKVCPTESAENYKPEHISNDTSWGVAAVGALSASNEGDQASVAILDTGIDVDHPAFTDIDFSGRLMDFSADGRGVSGTAIDLDGHGTHVAGTIFGRDVESVRIGVAPGIANVFIGKVIGPDGADFEAIKNGIDWAIREGSDVISLSLGMDFTGLVSQFQEELDIPQDIATSKVLQGYRSTIRLFEKYADAIQEQAENGRGAILVAASGNECRRQVSKRYTVNCAPPASADGFISVGAVSFDNKQYEIAPFSNTGCRLVGPGVSVLSAGLKKNLVLMSGTSMATPHVAGVCALWTQHLYPNFGRRPKGWARNVIRHVENSAIRIAGSEEDFGLGLAQAPHRTSAY